MGAGPAESVSVGPVLRDSVSVAIRHWPVVLLSLVAIIAWSLAVLFVIGRSIASAGLSDQTADDLTLFGVWFATRFVTWFILGSLLYRIVMVETGVRSAMHNGRDPRLRLLLACVLCFAGGSLITLAAKLAFYFGLDAFGLPQPDLENEPFSITAWFEMALVITIGAYIATRIAFFAACLLQRTEQAAFGLSWTIAVGARLKLFLVLFAIDLADYVLQLGIFTGLPPTIDLAPAARWLSAFALLPHEAAMDQVLRQVTYLPNVLMAALYAGVFVTIHRWELGREARAFD